MSSQEWKTIQYEKVPSRASMIYRKAFQKHDPEGYQKYLEQVQSGEKKINAAVLYPYEIYKEYHKESIWKLQPTLEELWKALPNYITDNKSFIVMADVSGSMSGDPMAVSVSLAIYAAERSKGPFSGHYISYSEVPLLVKVKGKTLADKLRSVQTSNVGYNTNIQAAFDLILNTAITHKLKQEDLPEMIFVISDMQFDDPQYGFTLPPSKFVVVGYSEEKVTTITTSPMLETLNFDDLIPILNNLQNMLKNSGWTLRDQNENWFNLGTEPQRKALQRLLFKQAEVVMLAIPKKYMLVLAVKCYARCDERDPNTAKYLIDVSVGEDFRRK